MKTKGIISKSVSFITCAALLSSCATNETSQTTNAVQTTAATTSETIEPPTESTATPVAYHGEMLADGNRIIGSKTNEVVRATGMSFFWSNWSQKYYTSDYVDLMMDDFGCEIVRCSYGIQDDGVPYDRSCEPLIEDVIEAAIERGLYVIVDWHSHGAHKNPDEAVAYFSRLAKKYGKYDNLIFEIYNEPKDVGWKDIKTYAEIVIPAIREYSDNLIIVGTPNWSQQVTDAADNPVEGENIAYALHFYAGTHKKWLRDNADRAMEAGIPLFVTEWGSVNADGNGGISDKSTQQWFEWIDKNQLSSCNWAINDKNEGSSIFVKDSEYSETGLYIKELIDQRTKDAEWRSN